MSTDGGGEKHVGPPRILEVQKFAAARSAESQALYKAVKREVESSGGDPSCLTIARHLRRRTTSHNRRVPYWIVNERKKNREGHASQKGKKTRKNEIPAGPGTSEKRKREERFPSRRVRRRIEFQRVRQGEDIVQHDGTRRLATHVWHAKRFPMKKCWGYSLPEGLAGRGRGSRAVLKWVKEAAVLHDASYYGLIELQGTTEAIARSLQQTVEPAIWFPSSGSPLKKAEAHGLLSGSAVLYQSGKAPYDAIAPITFLWRPPGSVLKLRAMGPEQAPVNVTQEERQLWIWVHPGAYDSALQCLLTACERQEKESETYPVKCVSRRSEFARLEILGSKATEVIRKVMHPSPRQFGIPRSKTTGQPPFNLAFFAKAEFLPASAVLALDVLDPRCKSSYCPSVLKAAGGVGDDGPHVERLGDIQSTSQTMADDGNAREVVTQDEASGRGERLLDDDDDDRNYSASWLKMAESGLSREVSDSEYLWNPQSGVKGMRLAPMSEKNLGKKRHEERKQFLLGVNQESATTSAKSSDQMNTSSFCPVLLLGSSNSKSPACGWTIILPRRWVHAFWIPLVFAGGRVIGLRERHWLATNAGVPHFPQDFPDCYAYAQLLRANVTASNEANIKRPPAKRCPCFVVSPLQASLLRVFEDNNLSSVVVKADEPVRSCIEAQSTVNRSFNSQRSCIPGAEKFIQNVEEPHDASCKVVEVEGHDKTSASDERQNDDKLLYCATDSVPMVAERRSDSVISDAPNDGAGLGASQSGLDKDQALRTKGCIEASPMLCTTIVEHSGVTVHSRLFNANGDTEISEAGMLTESLDVANVDPQCTKSCGEVYRFTSGGAPSDTEGSQRDLLPLESACLVDVVARCSTGLTGTAAGQRSIELNSQGGDAAVRVGEAACLQARSAVLQVDSSGAAVKTFTDERHASFDQNAPSDPSLTEPTNSQNLLPTEEAKTQLYGVMSASWARELESSDSGGAAIGTCLVSRICTPSIEGHALSNPSGKCAVTEVEVPQLRLEAPSLALNSNRSNFQADASETCQENDAVIVEVEGLNDFNDSRTASGECNGRYRKIHAGEDTFKNDEMLDWVGAKDKDKAPYSEGEIEGRRSLPFFVARTQRVLLEIFNQSEFQHALFLHQGVTSRGTIRDALQQETVRWSALKEVASSFSKSTPICALVNGEEKVCYLRILVSLPRKGVMEEGAVIFSPSKEDRDTFFRSKDWQGPSVVQPRNAKRKRKLKGKKVESLDTEASDGTVGGSKDTHENAVAFCEAWGNNRKNIGLITSSVPRGSTSPCIGICEVGALMKLRAAQSGDQRWWDRRDIFVLAGNKYSSKLRPALISLPLERAEDDTQWL